MAAKRAAAVQYEVWLDGDTLPERVRVGRLAHDRGQVRFEYERTWLTHPKRFELDPTLQLYAGPYFPNPRQGNFGVFLDSAPDRWGQMLMDRREQLAARDEGRAARALDAVDYLLGVQDATRTGALRFCAVGTGRFLDDNRFAAPPVASLRELEATALAITNKRLEDLDALRRWLAVLVAPGASLGGAHPKANFTDVDGTLWIAKFPAADDMFDRAAWEILVHDLAQQCRIDVPAARLAAFGQHYRTYCVQRFDRTDARRRFFVSAQTLLQREQSEGASYLDLAQFIAMQGAPAYIERDLEQLFRRVVFNIAVSNRDDHLRNHGFLWTDEGWRLAPAYDVNPNLDKETHVLAIDDADTRPSLAVALASADFYRLTPAMAQRIIDDVTTTVASRWHACARGLQIPAAEIELFTTAFGPR